jgi:DNA (cytosine-5)-methyltransferase 1
VTSQRQLVLSLFPGVGLLDRAFIAEGVSVVTGPEALFGQYVEDFHGVAGRFDGIIGGPPCQDFSCLRTAPPTGNGVRLLREFLRVVCECGPTWFVLENVPRVPDVRIAGYQVQRFDLWDIECGGKQLRCRHFQFGHRLGWIVRPERKRVTANGSVRSVTRRAVTAAAIGCDYGASVAGTLSRVERSAARRKTFRQHCLDQGLPGSLRLPGMRPRAAWWAIGNGVPLGMGRVVARAVLAAGPRDASRDCRCGCGRPVTPQRRDATAACRKRLERARRGTRSVVTWP